MEAYEGRGTRKVLAANSNDATIVPVEEVAMPITLLEDTGS